jgi:F0F1-type ATP synthase assembly protein I
MPDEQREPREQYRYLVLGQVGIEMAAPVVLGVLLDRSLGWTPWLTIIGAVLGFTGGMYHLLSFLKGSGRGDNGGGEQGAP